MEEIVKEIFRLLKLEEEINKKKLNKIPLTQQEFVFDNYLLKPSTVVRLILNGVKKDEKKRYYK